MHQILKKQKLAENIYLMQIHAPEAAKSAKPGQFIIIQADEKGERIPLSIADSDSKSVTVIFSVAGKSTEELSKLKKGSYAAHFAGPLGTPTEILKFGEVCFVAGGFGIAPICMIAKAMKDAGNSVTIVVGARTKSLIFWEDRLEKIADRLIITTDDGSKGEKGFVTSALETAMKKKRPDLVFAVGPLQMMKAVSDMTYQRARTIVSLSPIMLDGTGMCGSCRVRIAGEVKFACVDGPEFNGHAVDWNSLMNRNKRYDYEEKHACRCGK